MSIQVNLAKISLLTKVLAKDINWYHFTVKAGVNDTMHIETGQCILKCLCVIF